MRKKINKRQSEMTVLKILSGVQVFGFLYEIVYMGIGYWDIKSKMMLRNMQSLLTFWYSLSKWGIEYQALNTKHKIIAHLRFWPFQSEPLVIHERTDWVPAKIYSCLLSHQRKHWRRWWCFGSRITVFLGKVIICRISFLLILYQNILYKTQLLQFP